MPSFEFRNVSSVTIKSFSKVMNGQDHRSSYNYDLTGVCGKGNNRIQAIKWECPKDITFDIMEDRRAAPDPYTYKAIKDGDITKFVSDEDALNGFYVANPKVNKFSESEFSIKLTFIYE